MSRLNFGITVAATDNTQSAFRRAMSGIQGLARLAAKPIEIPLRVGRAGLGIMRDVQLGLRPLIAGIEGVLARGSSFSTIEKSFANLSRTVGDDTRQLSGSLVDAANGTLTHARAMEIANRAMAGGINVSKQLPIILDFASKKAVTTGIAFETAVDQMVTGLIRQSPAILDNFGLMQDGMDGVAAAFDSMNGKGAFNALSASSRKAEFMRQAMDEIKSSLARMGVSGREVAFSYAAAKASVSDMVDRLAKAITGSKAVEESLISVATVIRGFSEHFESGGTLKQVFFGKGGKNGLLGIVGSFFEDVADILVGKLEQAATRLMSTFWSAVNEFGTPAVSAAESAAQSNKSKKGDRPSPFGIIERLQAAFGFWRAGLQDKGQWPFGDGGNGGAGIYPAAATPRGAFPATENALARFDAAFGPRGRDALGKRRPPIVMDRQKDAPLTDRGLNMRYGERNLLEREIKKIEAQAARDARRMAAEQVREARRQGNDIDQEALEKEIREKLIQERTRKQRARLAEVEEEIERTWEWINRRGRGPGQPARGGGVPAAGGAAAAIADAAKTAKDGFGDLGDRFDKLIEIGGAILSALTGGDRQLAAVGGARA